MSVIVRTGHTLVTFGADWFTLGVAELADAVFRYLVDRTHVPYVLVDGIGTIRYAGSSVARLVGWQPDELIGRNMLEFIPEEDVDRAIDAVTEVHRSPTADAGLPMVYAVRTKAGGRVLVEVAAMPVLALSELNLTVLRLRSYEAEHHRSEFLRRLLAGEPLDAVLAPLTRSIAWSVEGVGAAVHHGFDGTRFAGVTGSWPEAACLPLDRGPWIDALADDGITEVAADADTALRLGATSCWITPIRGESLPPAVLSLWTARPDPPMLGHRDALADGADYLEIALARASEHERLRHLALHDSLTGLANRAGFLDELTTALREERPGVVVAFCDLDGFQEVNHRHGHGAGDDVLIEVASRLRTAAPPGAVVARMGGDEFTIAWHGATRRADVRDATAAWQAAIDTPFTVPGGTMRLGLSVGAAMARRDADPDGLLSSADDALRESKHRGGRTTTILGG